MAHEHDSAMRDLVDSSGRNSIPQCCCGRSGCAFLAHSCKVLEAVEQDARMAAELGQVCYHSYYSLLPCRNSLVLLVLVLYFVPGG